MAATVVTTAGAANANSYVSVAVAQAYHDENLNTAAWDDATADELARAVIMATRILDAYIDWHGTKVSTTQALAWPLVPDVVVQNGETIVSTAIPLFLQYATAEFAKFLLDKDRVADPAWIGIQSLGAGPAQVTFRDFEYPAIIPRVVQHMLSGYGVIAGASSQGRVERGG